MVIKTENKEATFLAANQTCNTKLNCVATDLHYVREKVEVGYLIGHQRADILTKTLRPKPFLEQKTNLVEILSQD